jgi:hypothetical protein
MLAAAREVMDLAEGRGGIRKGLRDKQSLKKLCAV